MCDAQARDLPQGAPTHFQRTGPIGQRQQATLRRTLFGDVVHDGVEAQHLVALAVGDVLGQRAALTLPVGPHHRSLEALRLATQGSFDVGAAALVEVRPQQVVHAAAGHLPGLDAEPLAVSAVGHAVVEVAVPVADHHGHRVEHRAQVVLGLLEHQRALADGVLQADPLFLVRAPPRPPQQPLRLQRAEQHGQDAHQGDIGQPVVWCQTGRPAARLAAPAPWPLPRQ